MLFSSLCTEKLLLRPLEEPSFVKSLLHLLKQRAPRKERQDPVHSLGPGAAVSTSRPFVGLFVKEKRL